MEKRRTPESDVLEYKREMTNSFLKTVSAFANFHDGTIEFGIDDNLNVIGIRNPLNFAENLTNKINDNIKPLPDYSITVNPADQTVILKVRRGTQTPYLYNNKAYERRNSSTIETGSLTLQDLILSGRNTSFDALEASRQDLSFQILEKKAIREMGIERLGSDVLKTFDLFSRDRFNRAAELLSDSNSYPGTELAVFGKTVSTIRFRKSIENVSVLKQYDEALSVYRQYYQEELIEGSLRSKTELIPEKAFREALVNALIHRNWAVMGAIQVYMFPDRIEISSPGGLPEGVSREAYLSDSLSVPRNPKLAYVFLRLNLIERLGTGVRRILEAYRDSDSQPGFSITDSSITVILPVRKSAVMTTMEQSQLLSLMNPNIRYTRKELEDLSGFSRSKLMRLINELIRAGLVKTSGSGRGTRYFRTGRI